jgi:hypothetical protein
VRTDDIDIEVGFSRPAGKKVSSFEGFAGDQIEEEKFV